MNKLLIGLSNNISANKLKIRLWHESFKKFSDGKVVLVTANTSQEDIAACEELGIEYHPVEVENTSQINHKRLKHIGEYVSKADVDLVLSTDVFDVVFQCDPFKKLDIKCFDFFVSGEGVNVENEPWNANNLGRLFGERSHQCAKNEVICSGVMAGKKDSMVHVCEKMFEMCESCPDNHETKDQAALIIMVNEKQIPNLKVFNLDEGWAVHCAVAGPTHFFTAWGFKDTIKYGIPKLLEDQICTSSGAPFDIVHQFNRIPEWHDTIKKRFL